MSNAENLDVENIKKFIVEFFKNLGSEITWKEKILKIDKIPENFQKFYGKKSPYYFVFEGDKIEEHCEKIAKGSFLLKAMSNFLEDRGQTSVLKLNIEFYPPEILRKKFRLGNCTLEEIGKKQMYNLFFRFTFITTLQYLNEKEQITSHVYIKEGKDFPLDLTKFNIIDGKKNEITIPDIREDYEIAKNILKEKLKIKIGFVGYELKKKLENELKRIENHYSNHLKEINDEIMKNQKQIEELKAKIQKGLNIEENEKKIIRLNSILDKIKNDDKKEKLEKEMDFFILDEKNKHSLNINNKLLNTSIIYYPVFIYTLHLRNNKKKSKFVNVVIDPLTDNIQDLHCESSGKAINDIYLCVCGHLCDKTVLRKCSTCDQDMCKICPSYNCKICHKEICKDCSKKCNSCIKDICPRHGVQDFMTAKDYCINCLRQCPGCNNYTKKENFKICSNCQKEICLRCLRSNIDNGKHKGACVLCLK